MKIRTTVLIYRCHEGTPQGAYLVPKREPRLWTRDHILVVGAGKQKDASKQGIHEQKLYLLLYALCPKGHRVGILSDKVWTSVHT